MQNVATVLRTARRAAAIAQQDLAAELGISRSYMNDIELGRNPFPESLVERLPDSIRRHVAAAMADGHLASAAELQKWAY